MMAEKEKPPIGVKPYYIFYTSRIAELTKAMLRCTLVEPERAMLYIQEIAILQTVIKTLADSYAETQKAQEEQNDGGPD